MWNTGDSRLTDPQELPSTLMELYKGASVPQAM
jgi:hypothetical protein